MEIPSYQPFYIETAEGLREEIARLGLDIPVSDDLAPLGHALEIAGWVVPNRFCANPIAGGDAAPSGAPGELTRRRYRRLAQGGFGLIWMEATAAGEPAGKGGLALRRDTLESFRGLVQEARAVAPAPPLLILQLTGTAIAAMAEAAILAAEAGFDGVDLQAPKEALPETLRAVRQASPALLLATQMCAYDGVRGGFGVHTADYRKFDLAEPIRFVEELRASGLALLNVTSASPSLRGPDRALRARSDFELPDEHPLMALQRQLTLAGALRRAAPGLAVVGSGFSWLRQFVPQVAAAALRDGVLDFAGLGRGALAYPDAPSELFASGQMQPGATCMICFACSQLRQEGAAVGCVIRDSGVYGEEYRQMRRFDADQLMAGANRCHLCEAAPCVLASPTRTDIPAFIQAFRRGEESRAYEIVRERDVLPELTSRLAPGWLECEGACVETALTGVPVPILDLQYAIAWRARDRGETGARVPPAASGRQVAIVGGGPAGLAAAVRLVEHGHTVHLFEQANRLGGAPERVIPAERRPDPQPEIEALLRPARAAGRLHLHLGIGLGRDVQLEDLALRHDAVLLATGLWQECSPEAGVIGALAFLEDAAFPVPARVVLRAGADSAMDAARAAHGRGVQELFIVFGGPRSAMHWHMPESWFATPGVHALMHCETLGYERDASGLLCGIRLRHGLLQTEGVLAAQLVIEAMEMQPADSILAALAKTKGRIHTAGALVNGGASVSQCVAEGLAAAEAIHQELSA